jgi:hypothetical protein
MGRSLTKREDKLPAISGLAKEVYQQTGFMYQAGIWLEDFQRGLLWMAYEYGERGNKYLAPSWSWASMEKLGGDPFHIGQFNGKQLERLSNMSAELLGCYIRLKGEDPFGLIHPICQYERFRNRALSGLSEGPDSLIKRPNFKIIYNFLIKKQRLNFN